MDFLQVPLIILLAVVAPVWIIAHYVTRWRTTKTLSGEDEKLLQELWESAAKMEDRIRTLERILDAEAPHWRDGVAGAADHDAPDSRTTSSSGGRAQ